MRQYCLTLQLISNSIIIENIVGRQLPGVPLLSLHNPVARAARALTGRYTGVASRQGARTQGYAGLTRGPQALLLKERNRRDELSR